MNPNLAQNLDPKLKETYDRIMGTELSKTASSPASVSGQARENLSSSPQPTHVPIEQVVVPQTPSKTPPAPDETKVEMVSINASSATPAAKPSSLRKISPIIFVVAGVGFFIAYTVVWLKIFNIF